MVDLWFYAWFPSCKGCMIPWFTGSFGSLVPLINLIPLKQQLVQIPFFEKQNTKFNGKSSHLKASTSAPLKRTRRTTEPKNQWNHRTMEPYNP